jgi:5-methylthioadenosine/S-adenosylhomocysteine deaminase
MSTLIHNCTAVLMDEADTVLKNAFVAVEGHSIVSVGDRRPEGAFTEEIDGKGGVLMPGLVNAHTHAAMTCCGATAAGAILTPG